MIPKIIHYCWFGHGEMSPLMKKCIKSWKKYCPDYQIIEWNEDNFDINSCVWTKEAYECKKYAFVADYVRLKVLYECGGIYLDADQELLKPIDTFLNLKCFWGFACDFDISAGFIGAELNNPFIFECLNYYNQKIFLRDNVMDLKPNTNIITQLLLNYGLKLNNSYQNVNNVTIFPQNYFCPTYADRADNVIDDNTVSIHHWAMTWRRPSEIKNFKKAKMHSSAWYKTIIFIRYLPNKFIRKCFGNKLIDSIKESLKK